MQKDLPFFSVRYLIIFLWLLKASLEEYLFHLWLQKQKLKHELKNDLHLEKAEINCFTDKKKSEHH